ncbi:MAG: hypothetical protein HYT62_02685 [Candidatus Yanofskybacteria bacterium]|nr:hypothetical protein [Candidatus Yanofskybacteria bacterium]
MVETPSTIEQDIAELEKQLESKKAALEHDKSERDILHGIIGEKIQQHVPAYQPRPASPSPAKVNEPPSYLTQELKDKIQAIIDLVFSTNLEDGIKEAAKSGNAALVDAFHDILVDELYGQLIERKKIDKVD